MRTVTLGSMSWINGSGCSTGTISSKLVLLPSRLMGRVESESRRLSMDAGPNTRTRLGKTSGSPAMTPAAGLPARLGTTGKLRRTSFSSWTRMVLGSMETTSRPLGARTSSAPRLMVADPSCRGVRSTDTLTCWGLSCRMTFLLPVRRTFTVPTGSMIMKPRGRLKLTLASTTRSLGTSRSSTEALNQMPMEMPRASSRRAQVRARSLKASSPAGTGPSPGTCRGCCAGCCCRGPGSARR